ncbi:MAG TPA: RNA polymerase sigma factor region1.1 domain-containing protein, partial [Kofleriaceae bacterium]|nr:RNA polymerase sigma factor region1.1 domain-containing protein [Kofleriaceae bacterium]
MARTPVAKTKKPDPKAKKPGAATAKEAPKKVDVKDAKDGREVKDVREAREGKEGKEAREAKEAKEVKDGRDGKEGREAKGKAKLDGDKKAKASADAAGALAKPAKPLTKPATKPPRPPRDEDDDGFDDDEEDDDFVPVAKAKPAKPVKLGKGGRPAEIDLDDGGDDSVIPAFEDDDDDDFGAAPKPRSLVSEADAAAMEAETRKKSPRGAAGGRDGNTARDKLIELGKQKGFVTYDEVNDHMPEDVVSTDQIDGWLAALGEHGIEVVDGSGSRRPELVDQPPKGLDIDKEKEEGEVDEDEEYAYSRTSDPVRMYLRKMGSVSLLTREGEVEIAKRIEDGERKMLQAVLNSSVAVEELLEIGERLRRGKVRVKDVVKDIDEDEAEFNEQFYVDRVCKIIDKVRKLQRDTEKLEEKLIEADTDGKKKKVKEL